MRAILTVLSGAALLLTVAAGLLGATSATVPATGLVIAPTMVWVLARHGLVGFRLLAGALRGTLPMESWPEAREVVSATRQFGLMAGGTASAASVGATLVLAPDLIGQIGMQVLLHAASPVIIAVGLATTLWVPLERALEKGYEAWLKSLKEALTPVAAANTPMRQVQSA